VADPSGRRLVVIENVKKKDSVVSDTTTHTVDATMAALGSKATYTGASTSVLGWLMSSEAGILLGILIGVAGLIVNWFYKHKEDKRRQAEHDKRMGRSA
jgi:predicted PurR-regulated permease PerM